MGDLGRQSYAVSPDEQLGRLAFETYMDSLKRARTGGLRPTWNGLPNVTRAAWQEVADAIVEEAKAGAGRS
jgi:hypothetical protein